jgi:hypothetical protein
MSAMAYNEQAREDFNRARSKATLSKILYALTPEKQRLLSLQDVRTLLRPKNETYKGMQTIPIDLIVGSEDRYQDFNHAFLPKSEHMRKRWENIDKAILQDIILPPIKIYKIGGAYFVSDGNHRVSVARSQGCMSIDAEVIELSSEVKIKPGMTEADLKQEVIQYEKRNVFEHTKIGTVIEPDELNYSEPGLFEETLRHIQGHKYFINQSKKEEIPIEEATRSWYQNVYKPIINLIEKEGLLSRFPGRTKSDLYMWIIRHWDDLKRKKGNNFPLKAAALDYSEKYGKSIPRQLWEFFLKLIRPRS